MVNPLILLAISLFTAFIFPLFEKIHINLGKVAVVSALTSLVVIPSTWILTFINENQSLVYSSTAGLNSLFTINVSAGIIESMALVTVNLLGLFIISQLIFTRVNSWKGREIILFMVMILGANGLILTRDLFNIFVFMEISSISLFGLLSRSKDKRVFEGGFKYMLATGVSSTLFLVGTGLFYMLAGSLNIDAVPGEVLTGYGAVFRLWPVLILTGLVIELKPALANGWAMDTYEAADHHLGAVMSGIQATAFLIVLTKLLSIIVSSQLLPVILFIGCITFIISQIQGVSQGSFKKMLGYSSSAQIGLVLIVLGMGSSFMTAIIILLSHGVAKSGLFFVGKYLDEEVSGYSNMKLLSERRRPLMLILGAVFILALLGLPPFPAFGAKWTFLKILGEGGNYPLIALILGGSLFEGIYLFRWLGGKMRHPEDGYDTCEEIVPDLPESDLMGIAGCKKISFQRAHFSFNQIFLILMGIVITVSGIFLNSRAGADYSFMFPFTIVLLFLILDIFRVKTKIQVVLSIATSLYYSYLLLPGLDGMKLFFGVMFLLGMAVLLIAFLNRKGYSPGLVTLIMGLMVSLGSMLVSSSNFQFFFSWEIMTITSYFLVVRGNKAAVGGFRYIIFSLLSAFLLLFGLILLGDSFIGSPETIADGRLVPKLLIAIAAVTKLANIGFHVWQPVTYAEAEDEVTALFSMILSKTGLFLLFLGGVFFIGKSVNITYILGWIGVLTALGGSMMALFQEDIKYTLAYSSMGQVGYMVLSFAIMSHLGWMSSLYLAFTHLMIKGMLILSITGVIYRTGTRFMYQTGGLIKNMPLSFISALFAIIAISGVPPLSGFGAKWLMYSALLEKGWYLQAALAMFASGVAFLYLFRLIHSIFLGQAKPIYSDVKEAPAALIIPQFIFLIIVMVVSMYPNLLIKPLEGIIDPYFASTIQWNGYEVISSLGYWNGNAVMYVTFGVFLLPLIWLLLVKGKVYKAEQFNIVYAAERPYKPETTHYAYNFFPHYRKALGFMVDSWAKKFWGGVSLIIQQVSGGFRRWNTGNPQSYMLQIILYLIFVYILWGGNK